MSRWLKTNYLGPLVLAVSLEALAFIIAFTLMPETITYSEEHEYQPIGSSPTNNAICEAFRTGLKRVKNTFTLYLYDAQGRLASRRICLTVFMLTIAVNFSKSGIQTLYLMKYPMCWSNMKVIVFNGVQLAVNWAVIWLLLVVLQMFLKMKDRHVAILGCVSSFVACVFMSLATTDVMVYEVAALGVMTRSIIPMLRSIISTLVDSTDQGAVFAGMGCIETLGAGVFGMIANRIYFATLSHFAGSVFLVFGGLMLISIALMVILNVIFARDEVVLPDRRVNSADD